MAADAGDGPQASWRRSISYEGHDAVPATGATTSAQQAVLHLDGSLPAPAHFRRADLAFACRKPIATGPAITHAVLLDAIRASIVR